MEEIEAFLERNISEENLQEYLSSVEKMILKYADKLPFEKAKNAKKNLGFVKSLLETKRVPKLALVGRRGAGKSAFINALLGRYAMQEGVVRAETKVATWTQIPDTFWEVMDSRGCQEFSTDKDEETAFNTFVKGVEEDKKYPDIIYFIVNGKEVDSALSADLKFLGKISEFLKNSRGIEIPIIVLVSHVDILSYLHVSLKGMDATPDDPESIQKLKDINTAVETLHENMKKFMKSHKQYSFKFEDPIPICSKVEWKSLENLRDKIQDPKKLDFRWNIEAVVTKTQEKISVEAQYLFTVGVDLVDVKKKIALIVVGTCASLASMFGASPLPLSDVVPIAICQAIMLFAIQGLAPKKHLAHSIRDFFAACGFTGFGVAVDIGFRQLIKVIPVYGMIVGGALAFASTWALGGCTILYFIDGETKLKEAYERMLEEGKKKAEEKKEL